MIGGEFLVEVWGKVAKRGDFLFLVHGKRDKKGKLMPLNEHFQFGVDGDWQGVTEWVDWWVAECRKKKHDLYFTPMVFSQDRRKNEFAKPTCLLWSDIDTGDEQAVKPTLLWKSGGKTKGKPHHQGIWVMDKTVDPLTAYQINHGLSKKIGADPSGKDVGQLLRVPGSLHCKDLNNLQKVSKALIGKTRKLALMRKYQDKTVHYIVGNAAYEQQGEPEHIDIGDALEKLPDHTTEIFEHGHHSGDRSLGVNAIAKDAIRAGLSDPEVFWLLYESSDGERYREKPNHAERIWRDISRARDFVGTETTVKIKSNKKRVLGNPVSKTKETKKIKKAVKKKEEEPPRFQGVSWAELKDMDLPEPEWLVKDWIREGETAMIAGEAKAAKSTVAREMAVSIATGRDFMNNPDWPVKQGRVLIINEEDTQQQVRKDLREVINAKTQSKDKDFWADDMPLDIITMQQFKFDEDDTIAMEEYLDLTKPDVVIFDCLYRMMDVDFNDAKEVQPALDWMSKIMVERGITPILLHHFNKSGDSGREANKVAGSASFHRWARSNVFITKDEESTAEDDSDSVFINTRREFNGCSDKVNDIQIMFGDRLYILGGKKSLEPDLVKIKGMLKKGMKPHEIEKELEDEVGAATWVDVWKKLAEFLPKTKVKVIKVDRAKLQKYLKKNKSKIDFDELEEVFGWKMSSVLKHVEEMVGGKWKMKSE